MKRRYDKQLNILQLDSGTLVWLYNPKRSKGPCPKLQCKWEGPYNIIQKLNDVIFKIQIASNHTQFHENKLPSTPYTSHWRDLQLSRKTANDRVQVNLI